METEAFVQLSKAFEAGSLTISLTCGKTVQGKFLGFVGGSMRTISIAPDERGPNTMVDVEAIEAIQFYGK